MICIVSREETASVVLSIARCHDFEFLQKANSLTAQRLGV